MTTTPATIRDSIAARIVALTPSAHTDDKFREHTYLDDLRLWAEANPTGCLRVFSVEWNDNIPPPLVTNTTEEQAEDDIEIVVAYPTTWRYGERGLVDLKTTIAADIRRINHEVGTNGFAALATATNTSATVTTLSEGPSEIGPVVSFGVVRLHVLYSRSPSA